MLLEDEAGFYRQPTTAPAWAPAGPVQPRAVRSQAPNRAIRAAIGFDPVTGTLVHRLRSSFTAVEMGRFYRWLSQACPAAERIFLVLDNWPIHFHPLAWRAIEDDPRLRVLWLPTYAPWLNPAEKVWKWVRQNFTHMHPWADDLPSFRARLDQALTRVNAIPQTMLQYTGTGNDKLYSS
jgi:hypothetical protein